MNRKSRFNVKLSEVHRFNVQVYCDADAMDSAASPPDAETSARLADAIVSGDRDDETKLPTSAAVVGHAVAGGKSPTKKQAAALRKAQGKARVLAIGVSNYFKRSNFDKLPVCERDARAFCDAFQNPILNADPARVRVLIDPSRGEILDGIEELAESAGPDDRLIVFHSGHGHRIGEDLYLVPTDARSNTDPGDLVALEKVKELLNGSAAKQKILFLDACFSGPDTSGFKGPLATMTQNQLEKVVAAAEGIALLSSSAAHEMSVAKSPNDGGIQLSLFTSYLVRGLAGTQAALEDGLLTFSSLCTYVHGAVLAASRSMNTKQTPVKHETAAGVILLGDFRPQAHALGALDLRDALAATDLRFSEPERETDVKRIVARAKIWDNQQYIEDRVNKEMDALGDPGEFRAALHTRLGLDTQSEKNAIYFDGGSYTVRYVATAEHRGFLNHEVEFDKTWFGRLEDIYTVLDCFRLNPRELEVTLSGEVDLDRARDLFIENRAKLVSDNRPDNFTVKREALEVKVARRSITFEGFTASELFGSDRDEASIGLVQFGLDLAGRVLHDSDARKTMRLKGKAKKGLGRSSRS